MINYGMNIDRREGLRLIVKGFSTILIGSVISTATRSEILVPLGLDRFSQKTDAKTNTRIIEGLDFNLEQSLIPANINVVVRGDRVNLSGPIVLPGYNVTILCRELNCSAGAAISTTGKLGNPTYKGVTAAPGSDGAKDTGRGGDGGTIIIMVGSLSGQISLDASGGNGGDAENGGMGLPGTPGSAAVNGHDGGPGSSGHVGGLAGVPGSGGSGGAITVGAIDGSAAGQIRAASGQELGGAPGVNGRSGAGGPGGPSASGWTSHTHPCPVL
jgi:hypothetical protein